MNLKNKKTIIIIAVILSLLSAIIILSPKDNQQKIIETQKVFIREISIIKKSPSAHKASISILGQSVPEWQTSLRLMVSGQITNISKNFRSGAIVKKGELLFSIDQTGYRNAVEEAKLRLETGKMNLLREKSEAAEAIENWNSSGFKEKPLSPLVKRKPQLKTALQEMKAANSFLKNAEKNLSYTEVRAPYTGIIVERKVSIGDTIFQGDEAGQMLSTKKVLITVYLTEKQIELLPSLKKDIEAMLYSSDQNKKWKGNVVRIGQYLETDSRLIPLIIEIKDPLLQSPPLIPGKFLKVELSGKKIQNLLSIKESCMTGEGYIWYIKNNLLDRYKPTPLFRIKDKLFVHPPEKIKGPILIASSPDSTYLKGIRVKAISGE